MSVEREKQLAAQAAAELAEDGMKSGLGTGSMVSDVVVARGEQVERIGRSSPQ